MTTIPVENNPPLVSITATAGQTVLPFTFLIQAETQMQVIQTPLADPDNPVTLVLNTDFTIPVTSVGENNGGQVVLTPGSFPTGATVGDIFTLSREIPITRTTDFQFRGSLSSDTLNAQLDSIFLILQEQERDIARAMTLNIADALTSIELPLDTVRADNFLAFDGSGNAIAAAGTSANLGPVSAFVDTLLPSIDAAAFRTGIDAPGLNVTNTFDGDQDIVETDPGATVGPTLSLFRNSASQAAGDDAGALDFDANDDSGTPLRTTYGRLRLEVDDPSAGSETGSLRFITRQSDTLAERFIVADGIYTPGATGGDPGADLINVAGVEVEGFRQTERVLLDEQIASNDASIDFSWDNTDGWDTIEFEWDGAVPATDDIELRGRISIDGGSTFISTSTYLFAYLGRAPGSTRSWDSGGTTYWGISGEAAATAAISNVASEGGAAGKLTLFDPGQSTAHHRMQIQFSYSVASNAVTHAFEGGGHTTNTGNDVDGFQFIMESGNISSGRFRMYGVRATVSN